MPVKVSRLHSGGVLLFTPQVFRDDRGTFAEMWLYDALREALATDRPGEVHPTFVQGNVSHSAPFVLRGLHYQLSWQGKLMTCLKGSIFQVSVDVRKGSKTFGEFVFANLDTIKQESVYVPPGFANGFFARSDGAIVSYNMTDYYQPDKERQLLWSDETVSIKWPIQMGAAAKVSPKDRKAPRLNEIEPWDAKLHGLSGAPA